MMRLEWQFDRGQFDPGAGTTPVRVSLALRSETGESTMVAVIDEESARQMRDDLARACNALDIASVVPSMNGGPG